jgi:hypothetical protein
MRRTGEPNHVPETIEKNVGQQVEYEITELVGRSRAARHVWHFMNAMTANLIQIHLCQQEPEGRCRSLRAIDEGDQ